MRRFLPSETDEILQLYSEGKSLNYLSKKYNHPKSSIYYITRKTFGRKYGLIKFNPDLDSEIGELVGAFAGDGSFMHRKDGSYYVRFYLGVNEMDYALHLSELVNKVFGTTTNIWKVKNKNVIRVSLYRKFIYETLRKYLYWSDDKTYTIRLRNDISNYSDNFLKNFLSGLIVTDGFVTVKSRRKIGFTTISKELSKQVSDILKTFNIHYIVNKTVYQNYTHKRPTYNTSINGKYAVSFKKAITLYDPNKQSKLEELVSHYTELDRPGFEPGAFTMRG